MTFLERCEPCDIPSAAEQAAEARSHGACEDCGETECRCGETHHVVIRCHCGAPAQLADRRRGFARWLCLPHYKHEVPR